MNLIGKLHSSLPPVNSSWMKTTHLYLCIGYMLYFDFKHACNINCGADESIYLKNSLIIQEQNTKKNHKRVVVLYVIKNHVNLHKL
jgi:hypothetical protein